MVHAHVSLSSCERPAERSTFRLSITSSARTCLRRPCGAHAATHAPLTNPRHVGNPHFTA
eukprot:1374183-Alexandrium_andersonii.AAC.1